MAEQRVRLSDDRDDTPDRPLVPSPASPPAGGGTNVCPECGQDLASVNLEAHAALHYPDVSHLHDPVYRHEHKAGKERREQLLSGGVSPDEFTKLHTPEEED
jgi:hypothetical protein